MLFSVEQKNFDLLWHWKLHWKIFVTLKNTETTLKKQDSLTEIFSFLFKDTEITLKKK